MTKVNNLPSNSSYFLRYFTSINEFDLCDHTTLPTTDILSKQFLQDSSFNELIFETKKAGELKSKKM
jgi:predicted PhzF superfamily epimerase YddE/YHI9